MSTYTDASLIVTPNSVKAGKLYSIKPTNGAGDLDVVRNTTATYVGSDGLIKTALANEVRFDYSNGSCPSILVEPQRTNLSLRSEEFDNATWIKLDTTVTANAIISPSGELKADLMTCTTDAITSNLSQTISVPSGSATLSVFAKAGNYNIFRIGNVSSSQRAAWFDLSTGTVIGSVNGGTASVQNYGNGWFRCIFTSTSSSSGTNAFIISISSGANLTTGVVGANIYLWGAQLESASNETSYIPTTTASVTRNADLISKTGISSLIGQTEGTIFIDFYFKPDMPFKRFLEISDGTVNNRLLLLTDSVGNKLSLTITTLGVLQSTFDSSVISNGRCKIALSYVENNVSLFANGTLLYNDISCLIPATNSIILGGSITANRELNDGINSIAFWKNKLTDEECINLTTL